MKKFVRGFPEHPEPWSHKFSVIPTKKKIKKSYGIIFSIIIGQSHLTNWTKMLQEQ